MLREVSPEGVESFHENAKLIIWVKTVDPKFMIGSIDKDWKKIYEDDFAEVYLNF